MPACASLSADLLTHAQTLGFDVVAITSPDAIPHAEDALRDYLNHHYHGDMAWMNDRVAQRANPAHLWPDVKSIIMCGVAYTPPFNPLDMLDYPQRGAIASYALRRDYHDVIKGRLKQLAQWVVKQTDCEVKVFVDTAPVMEKPLAQAAGLGWQGKNTLLVSRDHGCWLNLGAIYTTADLVDDPPQKDHCGSCRRCLDICPTQAFPAPYQLDARRCISYLTIEYKGVIDPSLREKIGNRIFGCDDCLAVCPWNKFAVQSREQMMALREDLILMPLDQLAALDDAGFRKKFATTAIKRTGRNRFVRNVLIAMGNSGYGEYVPQVVSLLADSSELVRGMAVWALKKLDSQLWLKMREKYLPEEIHPSVIDEWQLLLVDEKP